MKTNNQNERTRINISIALIMPYFGEWPQWSALFFDSCKRNKNIDFYFFTDCGIPTEAPNLFFKELSFEEYCHTVSSILHIDFHPKRVRKICDLKPFYGYIHKDILQKYDFWGYGDCDLVWGDIRAFYTDDLLQRYDILSTHADRLSGHLTLLRNTSKIIERPLSYKKWRNILLSNDNHAFDEIAFTRMLYPEAPLLWKAHKWIFLKFKFNNEWLSYNRFCCRFNRLTGLWHRKNLFVERNTTPWDEPWMNRKTWFYHNGRVTDMETRENLIYLHFLSLKKIWPEDFYQYSPNGVEISFEGIRPKEK